MVCTVKRVRYVLFLLICSQRSRSICCSLYNILESCQLAAVLIPKEYMFISQNQSQTVNLCHMCYHQVSYDLTLHKGCTDKVNDPFQRSNCWSSSCCSLNIFVIICSIVTNFDIVVSTREYSLLIFRSRGQGQIASLQCLFVNTLS